MDNSTRSTLFLLHAFQFPCGYSVRSPKLRNTEWKEGALRRFFEFTDVKQELPAPGSGAQAEVTIVGPGWACEVCQTQGT